MPIESRPVPLTDLYVAVVADVLDRLGYPHQVMDYRIRPLVAPERALVGLAHTICAVADDSVPENPYEHEIAAVDAVDQDKVIVIATGFALEVSVWGELLATRATSRGYAGVILDGGVRDLSGLIKMGTPTFAASVSANDSRGRVRVTEHGEPVTCGGVVVHPEDVVMADLDGVVVIPSHLVEEVARGATKKVAAEQLTGAALRSGASAADVYARYGVL